MSKWEKSSREEKSGRQRKNQSFSSSLLDEIYRSITDGEEDREELHFYTETTVKKHGLRSSRGAGEEQMARVGGAGTTNKWREKKGGEKVVSRHQRRSLPEFDGKWQYYQDPLFFSSSSCSSDSSYEGFSSSETESMKSFFAPPSKPRQIRTSRSERSEQVLCRGQSESHMFDDYRHHHSAEALRSEEEALKSKSKALKIYSNLKKVKQPISPGGRLATFLNSLFTAGNTKKSTKAASSAGGQEDWSSERKITSQPSTCSSASSFARSCLSKNSPSFKEKPRIGENRTVRFFPVSIIVDKDCRPCGHKCLYGEEGSNQMSASRKFTKRNEGDHKFQDKTGRVESTAGEFRRGFHQKKNDNIFKKFYVKYEEEEEDENDDAASCASSDLFELDHLALIGKGRYQEELPVYETTHIDTNRAIAKGLLV